MAGTQTNGALGKVKRPARVHPQRRRANQKREGARVRPEPAITDLQSSRAELTELRTANRELMQRIAALESELSTARKQIDLLQHSPQLHPQRREPAIEAGPRPRARMFGAAVAASLIGLGRRAVRRGS
jgi:predicted RNase H-like nuclease (RuvC/YqgF family)